MPDKQDARMVALFKRAHSIRSIARDVDRSRSQVYRVLRAKGLLPPAAKPSAKPAKAVKPVKKISKKK